MPTSMRGVFLPGNSTAEVREYPVPGWECDGGHADYVLVEESTCVPLFSDLDHVDGALIACGFGTADEAYALAAAGAAGKVVLVPSL
ncbi:hypothetical protein CELL_00261 [Cellulomonas sp. T2.31MG-18]|uniref:hypothetical protein n=1 Tax=Cellulomonas sp. T2.31MG-18 TaxID=3157619 RepID=UPI0035E85B25